MSIFSLFIGVVLAAEGILSPIPDPLPTISPRLKPLVSFGQLPVPEVLAAQTEESVPTTNKQSYTIAVLGDSMVDTLGPGVPHLEQALKERFPQTTFTIYNYGVGSSNIDFGLERLSSDYLYLDQPVPALVSRMPDIVIVESFAYNPYSFDEGALETHWLKLSAIVDSLKARIPHVKVVVAATVAPDPARFADGAGLSFTLADKQKRTETIRTYLENAIKFARSQNLPLADSYSPSLANPAAFINAGDNIHPSEEGKLLFAKKVVEAIASYNLLE